MNLFRPTYLITSHLRANVDLLLSARRCDRRQTTSRCQRGEAKRLPQSTHRPMTTVRVGARAFPQMIRFQSSSDYAHTFLSPFYIWHRREATRRHSCCYRPAAHTHCECAVRFIPHLFTLSLRKCRGEEKIAGWSSPRRKFSLRRLQ